MNTFGLKAVAKFAAGAGGAEFLLRSVTGIGCSVGITTGTGIAGCCTGGKELFNIPTWEQKQTNIGTHYT